MINQLRVPCAYQGGKQRVAAQIVDILLDASRDTNSRFYDLCCGSAAVSIELVRRGVEPGRICMLDIRVRPGTFLFFAKFSDHEAYGSQTQETQC
jgi:hypothetical protein